MMNEIEHYTPGDIAQPGPIEPTAAVSQLMQHAQAMDAAFRLAENMCATSLVPSIYRGKPQEGTAAILYGAELGLSPIQSLQNIFPVHGMPSIYARTMVALVKAKGYLVETIESTDESVTVRGTDPRTGHVDSSTWTIERAVKAGYVPTIDEKTGKFALNSNGKLIGNEKYLKDPQAMLYAKSATEVCRKIAPEVLLGIPYTAEELELEGGPIRATAERVEKVKGPKGTAGLADRLGVAATASNPVAKQDTPQVSETKPESESDPEAKAEPAAKADPKPSRADLARLNELLTNEKLDTREQKLEWLEGQFGRKFSSAADLTKAEATVLIDFLEKAQAEDAAKAPQ